MAPESSVKTHSKKTEKKSKPATKSTTSSNEPAAKADVKAKKDVEQVEVSSKKRKAKGDELVVEETKVKAKKSKKADAVVKVTEVEVEEAAESSIPQEKSNKKAKKSKAPKAPTPPAVAPEPIPSSPAPLKKSKKDSTKQPETSKKSKKPTPKAPSPSPEPEPSQADDAAEVEAEASDSDADLHGFSTDDDDSSDEEDAMNQDEPSAFDVAKLPTIAKDDLTVKRRLEKAKRQPTEDRGVLYLGRIPHGFYEDQLKAYFSQFGTVTRLRLSRNKKTGHSKHFGYIEFDSSSVAQIVADTMDNYLLMGHILRCKLIPKDQVHPELWVGANRKWRIVPSSRLTLAEHNKLRTEEEQEKAAKRLIRRQNQRKRKLAEAGIKYDFDAVAYKKPKAVAVDV